MDDHCEMASPICQAFYILTPWGPCIMWPNAPTDLSTILDFWSLRALYDGGDMADTSLMKYFSGIFVDFTFICHPFDVYPVYSVWFLPLHLWRSFPEKSLTLTLYIYPLPRMAWPKFNERIPMGEVHITDNVEFISSLSVGRYIIQYYLDSDYTQTFSIKVENKNNKLSGFSRILLSVKKVTLRFEKRTWYSQGSNQEND